MINGIGVVGWGVGGIEAEAGMLGQPVYFLTPDVVGFEFTGRLREGVTATDLVLAVTEILRKEKVVGKFVEFFGDGTESLSVPDRATIGQHGARVRRDDGLLPGRRQDDRVLPGHRPHEGRDRGLRGLLQGAGHVRHADAPARSTTRRSSGSTSARVAPSLAGPKRPQDRIEIAHRQAQFTSLFSKPPAENGFNQPAGTAAERAIRCAPTARSRGRPRDGDRARRRSHRRAALRRGDGCEQADARRRACTRPSRAEPADAA